MQPNEIHIQNFYNIIKKTSSEISPGITFILLNTFGFKSANQPISPNELYVAIAVTFST